MCIVWKQLIFKAVKYHPSSSKRCNWSYQSYPKSSSAGRSSSSMGLVSQRRHLDSPQTEEQSLTRGSWQSYREKPQPNHVVGDNLRAMTSQDIKITTGKWSMVLLSKNSAKANLKYKWSQILNHWNFFAALRFSSHADQSQLGHSLRGVDVGY